LYSLFFHQGNAAIDENTPGFFDSWNDDGNLPQLRMSTRKCLPSPLFFTKRTELQIQDPLIVSDPLINVTCFKEHYLPMSRKSETRIMSCKRSDEKCLPWQTFLS